MKLKEDMYVRFKTLSNEVKIGQIQLIDNIIYDLDNNEVTTDKYIIKASHNIIDLIEPKDIVVGIDGHKFEVYAIGNDCVYINGLEEFIYEHEIKSIITKEQFESMKYTIKE